MPVMTIQQFRATLASRADQGALVRAYREITRRPGVAAEMKTGEWAAWPSAVAHA